jgi:lipopolysaccharide export system protein LptA
MKKAAWCLGVMLFAIAASAQTEAPRVQVSAQQMERSMDGSHLSAKGQVEINLGSAIVSADEATIQWATDKTSAEIRPMGNVVIKLTKLK